MNMFMNHDGETIAKAYKILVALHVKIGGLGCEKYDDGFNLNNELIKSKIVSMIAVTDKKLALNLQILDRANQFTPDDLVSYLVATDNLADEGQKIKDINRAIGSSHSLALKAKHVQEDVASDEESDVDGVDDMLSQLSLFTKNMKFRRRRSSMGSSEKKRMCYNCDESTHFAESVHMRRVLTSQSMKKVPNQD